MKKIIQVLLIAMMSACLALGIVACTDDPTPDGEATYLVTVQSAGGQPLEGVRVRVLSGENAVDVNMTNEDGLVAFNLDKGNYTLELTELPLGYTLDEEYTLTPDVTELTIQLASSVIEEEMPAGTVYQLGDVMYDFTYTEATSGEEKSLSGLFETKKAVLLNFWYDGCSPCEMEFPLMESAYRKYQDDLAIVAITPGTLGNSHTLPEIADYMARHELTFDATLSLEMDTAFNITGYPTNIMIDRYGVVCMIESGAILDENIFLDLFENYTKDDYTQDPGADQEVPKPDIPNPDPADIAAALNGDGAEDFTYRWEEGEAAEYTWPWAVSEDGESIYATNVEKNGSYSILYSDIAPGEGQVIAFEYKIRSETDGDILYAFIDEEIIGAFSGDTEGAWETFYVFVGDGQEHELAFSFIKDAALSVSGEEVCIRNLRVTNEEELIENDVAMDVLRQAVTGIGSTSESYVSAVYNEEDNYYHVGSADGPYLLAELNNETQWGFDIYSAVVTATNAWNRNDGSITEDDPEYFYIENYDALADYAWLGTYSDVHLTPVTPELRELLIELVSIFGNDDATDNEEEWLKICRYYEHYGTGEPIEDPVLGLTNEHAITAHLGTNTVDIRVSTVPRGQRFAFTPTETGYYAIYSTATDGSDTYAWLFGPDGETILTENDGGGTSESGAQFAEGHNFEIIWELRAGETYYIACDYFTPGLTGSYTFEIRPYSEGFIPRPVAHGAYVFDEETGEISLPQYVNVALAADGTYHAYDSDGNDLGLVYVQWKTGTTFSDSPLTQWIGTDRFNFTENGFYATYVPKSEDDFDFAARWKSYFEIEANKQYMQDYTAFMQSFAPNDYGFVAATEELVNVLKVLMALEDRWTDNAWTQLCYYIEVVD